MTLQHFESKSDARTWALRLRENLSAQELAWVSARITARLLASPEFEEATTLVTYVGSKPGELDTRDLIEAAWAAERPVMVPITRPGGVMEWSRLERFDVLAPSPRGILEPRPEFRIPARPLDGLCVVPGLCFRRDGHRIGFGGGYYDRFLEGFQGRTVGLAPALFFDVEFPIEPHDQAIEVIVTETGFHRV